MPPKHQENREQLLEFLKKVETICPPDIKIKVLSLSQDIRGILSDCDKLYLQLFEYPNFTYTDGAVHQLVEERKILYELYQNRSQELSVKLDDLTRLAPNPFKEKTG